jgi:TRAP-type mannitol/chloroaromatic compound transport system permease large subunit
MAVIMAAMSGIIGGEVVLLGLIALPQMLRLGYNQNLAIGTICASGSLGTMIPPSIVLIFYGLVTETSIKALFTASFIPGFMLASFFIIYILVVTRLKPETAPLPEPSADDIAAGEKRLMFLGFLSRFSMWITGVIFFRALFFTVTGENIIQEGVDPIFLGMVSDLPYIAGAFLISLALVYFVVGKERTKIGWDMGKGLIAPTVVMGVIAVFVIGLIRREMTFEIVWDAVMRTLKSTGTIIWVTIGAAALAAAYTLVGGPTYIANLIIGYELPTMGVILFMMLIFLIMGMFMDWVGIVLLIMPVFLPIVKKLPIQDIGVFGTIEPKHIAVWFGVVFCMNMQVSFLSPPFGPAAFYLKSVAPAHISLTDIFRGFLPFIAIQLVALSVLLLWPRIVTILL